MRQQCLWAVGKDVLKEIEGCNAAMEVRVGQQTLGKEIDADSSFTSRS
jgi:hypothetical protein